MKKIIKRGNNKYKFFHRGKLFINTPGVEFKNCLIITDKDGEFLFYKLIENENFKVA